MIPYPSFPDEHKQENSLGLMKYHLKSLLLQYVPSEYEKLGETEFGSCVVAICLQNLESNMRLNGHELSSRHYSWTNMSGKDSTTISEAVGFQLRQYLIDLVRDNVSILTDPSPYQVIESVRKNSELPDCKRCLFLLNGHGMPDIPADNAFTLWKTDDNPSKFLEYVDLIQSMKSPSCFIIDSDSAGSFLEVFQNSTIGNPDRIGFFSCSADQRMPHRVGLPSDLFTSCMLTPALIQMLYGSRQFYAFKLGGLHEFPLSYFSDENGIKPFLMTFAFEVGRLIDCLVRAMITQVLQPRQIFDLFYRDKGVGRLFVNFCLARRIGSDIGFDPISYPAIPDFSRHQLWQFLDMYVDRVLLRLTQMDSSKPVSKSTIESDLSKFLNDALIGIEHFLSQNLIGAVPNELAFFPLILQDKDLVNKGLRALCNMVDTGEAALNACILEGLLYTLAELTPGPWTPNAGYCCAKMLCYIATRGNALQDFYVSPHSLILQLMSNPNPTHSSLVLALILESVGLQIDPSNEIGKLDSHLFGTLFLCLASDSALIVYWALIFVTLLMSRADVDLPIDQIAPGILKTVSIPNTDVRYAFSAALTALITYDYEGVADYEQIYANVVEILCQSPSHLIRMQALLLTHAFISAAGDMKEFQTALKAASSVLTALSEDPSPEICMLAISLLKELNETWAFAQRSLSSSLVAGSFEAFERAEFKNLDKYQYPPFSLPVQVETVQKSGFPDPKKFHRILFTEIDHCVSPKPITSNIEFIGGERIAYGNMWGTITIRNYSDHSNEFTHAADTFLSGPVAHVPVHCLESIDDSTLIAVTRSGTTTVLSHIQTTTPLVADTFRLAHHPKIRPPCIDFYKPQMNLFAGNEDGTVETINIYTCDRHAPFSASTTAIKDIQMLQCGLLGTASDVFSGFDLRASETPVFSLQRSIRSFASYNQTGVFLLQDHGGLVDFDIRSPSQVRTLAALESPRSIDAWNGLGLVYGAALDVVEASNGRSFSVLQSLFANKSRPALITGATFHGSKPTISFCSDEVSVHVVGLALQYQ